MKPSFFILILAIISGCSSTKPTPYQKEKKKEGYRDLKREEFDVSSFRANARTKKGRAEQYALFRSIEKCRENALHVNIIAVVDQTIEKEIIRSSGGGWGPNYGFGMYPYYGRHSSFGFGATFNTVSTDSWREVLKYPFIEVYYKCAKRIYRPMVEFKELSAEQIKHLVKDIKGGLQVEKVHPESPNTNTFQSGDIVLKANGKRVERIYDLTKLFGEGNKTVNLEFLREGNRMFGIMRSQDLTSEATAEEEKIIKDVCARKDKKKEEILRETKLCRENH